jgi:hypothetical protein
MDATVPITQFGAYECMRDLARLDPDERELFDDLRTDRPGMAVRLEQERVDYAHVLAVVRSTTGA